MCQLILSGEKTCQFAVWNYVARQKQVYDFVSNVNKAVNVPADVCFRHTCINSPEKGGVKYKLFKDQMLECRRRWFTLTPDLSGSRM